MSPYPQRRSRWPRLVSNQRPLACDSNRPDPLLTRNLALPPPRDSAIPGREARPARSVDAPGPAPVFTGTPRAFAADEDSRCQAGVGAVGAMIRPDCRSPSECEGSVSRGRRRRRRARAPRALRAAPVSEADVAAAEVAAAEVPASGITARVARISLTTTVTLGGGLFAAELREQ